MAGHNIKHFFHQWCDKQKLTPQFDVRNVGSEQASRFLCEVQVPSYNYIGVGNSTSKKGARFNAAQDFISFLVENKKIHKSELPKEDTIKEVHRPEPQYWAIMTCYESKKKVGEFKCRSPTMIIRGDENVTQDNVDCFCLGQLHGINCDSNVKEIMKIVGKGVQLDFLEGDLYIKVLSDCPVEVFSSSYNYHRGLDRFTTVKVRAGSSLKIFYEDEFSDLLIRSENEGLSAFLNNVSMMCIIRFAFMKPIAGPRYWFEFCLQEALARLDQVELALNRQLNPRFCL